MIQIQCLVLLGRADLFRHMHIHYCCKFSCFCFFILHRSSTSTSSQCIAYLNDTDSCLDMLSRYPTVKAAFIKYNTVLPSSAAVERLFSAASIILSKRRNRLSDDTFEKLLLLHQNRHLSE